MSITLVKQVLNCVMDLCARIQKHPATALLQPECVLRNTAAQSNLGGNDLQKLRLYLRHHMLQLLLGASCPLYLIFLTYS